LKDVTHRFAAVRRRDPREMINESGRGTPDGYRGRPPLDIAALADTLARMSLLIADHEDRIAEIDVNPLFVRDRRRRSRRAFRLKQNLSMNNEEDGK